MKRFSQTLKISLALFLAMFGTSALPTASAYAVEGLIADQASTETADPVVTPPPAPAVTPPADIVPPVEDVVPTDVVETPVADLTQPPTPAPSSENTVLDVLPLTLRVNEPLPAVNLNEVIPEPSKPVMVDVCGASRDTYTIPTTTGVTYYLKGQGNSETLLSAGVKSSNGDTKVTIIAKANTGYIFDGQKTEVKFDLDFSTKCVICHATASAGNPYTSNDVDESSIDGVGNGDHFLEHTGPIFPAVGQDGKWGDIIPPVGEHNGLNWTEEGQAIYNKNCATTTPRYYLVTSNEVACGEIKISLRNVSPWIYAVSYSTDGSTPNADGPKFGPVVDNRGEYPDDQTKTKTLTFTEDENGGSITVKYVVAVGSESDLYKNLPVGQVTTVVVDTNCKDTPTTPVAPKIKDICYQDKDGIYIGYTHGVIYQIGEKATKGWVPFNGNEFTVTAVPKEGFVFTEGSVTSWTYTAANFTNEQCLTITKTAEVASDTNLDGLIGVGDTVTWTITVTNTSENDCEEFYVTVEDPNTVLEDNGYIGYLGAGESTSLTATSTITANDLKVCKVVNTATLFGWRQHQYTDVLNFLNVEEEDETPVSAPLATKSAFATYALVCPPVPSGGGGQILGETTTKPVVASTPQVLPATIPATGGETNYLILGVVMSAFTYFAMMRRQEQQA